MKELVQLYPSVVAKPYLLIKNDLQKKDMQRFWFENTISFLAILAGSDLVNWYKDIKYKDNKTEKDIKTLKMLSSHPALTNVGLDQMSLGKWVMMLRESIKVLKEHNVNVVFPEVLNFYNKDTEGVINKLVVIRNNDAHGHPIPKNKLKTELDKRQELIDYLVERLNFLKEYRLIMPEQIEIEGGRQLYLIKEFRGNNVITSKEDLSLNPRLNDVIVINKDKSLSVLPYIVYLGKIDESKNFLGVFSKYVDKDKKVAKYLNLEGSGEINFEKNIEIYQIDFIEERKNWNEIYTNPTINQVNLNAYLKFDEKSIKVDEEATFGITLDNRKSTSLFDVRLVIEIPKIMKITFIPKTEFLNKIETKEDTLVLEISNLEERIYKIENISFKVTEQGFLNLTNANIFFKYYQTEMDEEANILSEGEVDLTGDEIEVIDPASRDKMIPIINVKKEFLDIQLNPVSHVKVGEDFVFEVTVKNIGFSTAKDILIDIVFPEGLNLKEGKETIRISTLNPMEEKKFQYIFSSQIPNFYAIDMQNVTFKDLTDKRYVTKCSDQYFIVVRSDILTEFKFKIKKFIGDLYIDEKEQKEIKKTVNEIKEKLDIDAEKFYKEVEIETVIEIIRDIIKKATKKRGLNFTESIYEESKSDSNFTGKERRKSLVFSCEGIPFFAINLSNSQNPEFFGLKTYITKNFDKVEKDILIVKEGRFFLEHKVDYYLIRNTEKYSVPFINQWVNFILNKVQNEYLIWKNLVKKVSEYFNVHLKYMHGVYQGDYHQNSAIKKIQVLFDRENKKFLVGFELKNRLKNLTKNDAYLKLADNFTLEFNGTCLGRYVMLSDRVTKVPAIILSLKSIEDIEEEFRKVEELYIEILYLNIIIELNELKVFIEELYKNNFMLKEYDDNKYLIYNFKIYKDFEITPENSISIIKKTKRGFVVYPKTYSDFSEEVNNLVKFNKFSWTKEQPLKFIKAPFSGMVANEVLKTAKEYEKDKLFVWPKKKDAILTYGDTEYGIFIVSKNLYKGIDSFEEIKKEFPNEKDFSWFISRIDKLENEYKFISPIRYKNEKFYIAYEFKEAFDDLHRENPEFDYIGEGEPLRLRLNLLKNQIEIFKNKSIGNYWVSKTICNNNYYSSRIIIVLSITRKNELIFVMEFQDVNKKDELEKLLKSQNFGENAIIKPSGRKGQHLKVELKIPFENFDAELEINIERAKKFFNKCIDFVNKNLLKDKGKCKS